MEGQSSSNPSKSGSKPLQANSKSTTTLADLTATINASSKTLEDRLGQVELQLAQMHELIENLNKNVKESPSTAVVAVESSTTETLAPVTPKKK